MRELTGEKLLNLAEQLEKNYANFMASQSANFDQEKKDLQIAPEELQACAQRLARALRNSYVSDYTHSPLEVPEISSPLTPFTLSPFFSTPFYGPPFC